MSLFLKSGPIFPPLLIVFFFYFSLSLHATNVLMVQRQWMALGKHYLYCCKAEALPAKTQEPAQVSVRMNEGDRASALYPLLSSLSLLSTCLPKSTGAALRDCWGIHRRRRSVFFSFRGKEKGINISRNRLLHVDISLPLLGGRLSIGWIKLSWPIPTLVL